MIENALIKNPKRALFNIGQDSWYPYYAGYSSDFVKGLLNSVRIDSGATILDPWNGSGTTTTTANNLGYPAIGYDLNPVMVIAAKAGLINSDDFKSIKPLSIHIVNCAESDIMIVPEEDPLCVWLSPSSANYFRRFERALQKVLVDRNSFASIADVNYVDCVSSTASFFYVAIFRTLNHFLAPFKPTNPTWIKLPKTKEDKLTPEFEAIKIVFHKELQSMLTSVESSNISIARHPLSKISLASSCSMPAQSKSVDLIISSPPYCTRIDYAVATMPELTLLGYHLKSSFDKLRRNLIGASTISKEQIAPDQRWGQTCTNFLKGVYNHSSKASKTYYYKSHIQYFDSIFKSFEEIERVLKVNGYCILVVQDSYYKDIYNNLQLIFKEMAEQIGLELVKIEHFATSRNMAKRNPGVKRYRTKATATESVLCFKK